MNNIVKLFFFILCTATSKAQVINTSDTLPLMNPMTEQDLPKTKVSESKHREFVVSWFKPYLISSSDTEEWAYPYQVDGESENVYYTYQNKVKYTPIFEGGRGLTIALTYKKQKWLPNLYLKYGFGFHSFDFSFTLKTVLLNKTTILIPEVYSPEQSEVIQYANEASVDPISSKYFYSNSSILHPVFSFYMPLALEYKLTAKTALGIDLNFMLPIYAQASGYIYDSQTKKYNSALIHTAVINRLLTNVGLHIHHNFYKKYFAEAYGNFGEIFNPQVQKLEYRYRGLDYTYIFNFGIKFGIYF
jgi:hypothetical protein